MNKPLIYDLIIIGAGPAGLTASIYASRYRLANLVIGEQLGGELALAHKIENYPGFPEGTSGLGLMELFHKQAKKFGVKFKLTDVKSVNFEGEIKEVETFRNIFEAKAVIVASGGRPRTTNAENEKKYLFDETEREAFIKTPQGAKAIIQRFKGLGEMNADELWETTMNPETRRLKMVQIEDAEKADATFDMLMGSEVAPRKRFIQTHADQANIDVT